MATVPGRMLLCLASLSLAATGCRTTSDSETKAEPSTNTLDPTLTFAHEVERALYLKMLGAELENGINVPKDQIHSASGVIECRKDGVLETCLMRVRLKERDLSGLQPLDSEVSQKVWSFIRGSRDELKDERLVLIDLVCDYVGKKSPPFDVEDVACKGNHPRMLNESVFGEPIAEELSEGLRGEAAFGNQIVTLNGAVTCRWVEGSGRTPCTVRSVGSGALQERIIELSSKTGTPVARRLLQAALDFSTFDAKPGQAAPEPPKELMASLTCIVDNSAYEREGVRRHVCRARM